MTEQMSVRPARLEDAAAIATIYNEGIADRLATFETEPRNATEVADSLRRRAGQYPAVVVEAGPSRSVVAFAWPPGIARAPATPA